MDDADLVDVLHPCEDLLHEPYCLFLVQPLFFNDVVEQFTSRGVLHDEVDVCLGLDDLHERRYTS